MIKGILFDFFGVIYSDTFEEWLKANGLRREGAFQQASYDLDTGKITFDEFLQRLSEQIGHTVTRAELDASARLNNGVVKLLPELSNNYKLGIISNATTSVIGEIIDKYDLAQFFDTVVVSSEVGVAKPDPEIFETSLRQMELAPNEVIFVDDNPNFVSAAEKFSIRSIQYTSLEQLEGALTNTINYQKLHS